MSEKKKKKSKKMSADQKKIVGLEQKVEEMNINLDNQNEKFIKLLAEFDNFQRRTITEKEAQKKFQSLDIVKDLLPAIDDLDRTVKSDEFISNKNFLDPIVMIKSKIENTLKKHSVESFDSFDKKFDPSLHEALLEQESDIVKKGLILEEFEKGYKYYDKVIRHAKVVVSKGKK